MSGNKEQIDVSLIGNDKIEEAIVNIQKEPTEENLVRALSIVKHISASSHLMKSINILCNNLIQLSKLL